MTDKEKNNPRSRFGETVLPSGERVEICGTPHYTLNPQGNWVSYVFTEKANYYQVQHAVISVRFYDYYTEVWSEDFSKVKIHDDRWAVEYLNKKGKWVDSSFYGVTRSYEIVSEDELRIIRTGNTDIGIRKETYIFKLGEPCKLRIEQACDEAQTIRFLWKPSGIVASKETADLTGDNKQQGLIFQDARDNFVARLAWFNELNICDSITPICETHAQGRKATITFGDFNVATGDTVILDPTEEQTSHESPVNLQNALRIRAGQRLTISNRSVSKLGFWLSKNGSPTGNITFTIRKVSDDSVIVSKVWGDVSSLSTSAVYREVTFDSPVTVNEEVRISAEWGEGGGVNYIQFWYQEADVKADEYFNEYLDSWDYELSKDAAYIYTYSPPITAPTVTTQNPSNISTETATSNQTITDNGGENCDKRGACWNTTGNPTVADSKSEETDSFGTGAFARSMTGLTPGQHYYVRGYAHNSAGYGYGNVVEFYTNKDCTSSDSGSGVGASTQGATLIGSETGSGVDAHEAVAPQSVGDVGSGVDAMSALLAALSRSDSGLGADAMLSFLVALIRADVGSGVEHILDRDLVLSSESGIGADTVLSLLGKVVHESGIGTENSYLHILEGVKSSSDIGSGAETSLLTTLFQRHETGIGVETVVARALYAKEYPTGAIDLARVLTAAVKGEEVGEGVEASLRSVFQKASDTGIGTDVSTLKAMFSSSDVGIGAEAITLLAAMVSHDTGVGVDEVIDFFRKLIDSGHGEENLHLIGYIGRAMKLITYVMAYSDLVVYTKPYSDLRVYTSEVKQT